MTHRDSLLRFAEAILDPSLPPPRGVVSARGSVDAARFAVYRNNVHVGLVGALEGRFPVTRRLVGEPFFRAMARAFVGTAKPASPLLNEYGDGFPDFVVGFPPAAELVYLADVARLEALSTRAYAAADAEPMPLAGLAGLDPDRLADTRVRMHPSAGWLSSPYPVVSIWLAHREAEVAPVAIEAGESALVVRPDADVVVHRVGPASSRFVAALFGGASLGAAATAATHPDFDFGTSLVGLIATGAVTALSLEDRDPS
jgi:hypothetical protein